MNTIPFFYVIRHKETGLLYGGSRTANGCSPEMFMCEGGYTTSSTLVNLLIEDGGFGSFEVLKIRTFTESSKAVEYEQRFLTRIDAQNNPFWLNRNNGGLPSHKGRKRSEETRKRLSVSKKGKTWEEIYGTEQASKMRERLKERCKNGFSPAITMSEEEKKCFYASRTGVKRSEEFCQKMREINLGKVRGPQSEHHKSKIGDALRNRKKPIYICPHCNKSGGAGAMKRWHFEKCNARQDF